jgi:hypothetical protein
MNLTVKQLLNKENVEELFQQVLDAACDLGESMAVGSCCIPLNAAMARFDDATTKFYKVIELLTEGESL